MRDAKPRKVALGPTSDLTHWIPEDDPTAEVDVKTFKVISSFSELHEWPRETPRWIGWLSPLEEAEEARVNMELRQAVFDRASIRWMTFVYTNEVCDQELAKKPDQRFKRGGPGGLAQEVWELTCKPYIMAGLIEDDPEDDRHPEDFIEDSDTPREALEKETRHQIRVRRWHDWMDEFGDGWWKWFMDFYKWKLQAAMWAHWCPWGSSALRGWPYIADGDLPLYRWMPQTWDPGMEGHPKNSPEEVFQRLTGLPICRVPSCTSWIKIMLDGENPLIIDPPEHERLRAADRLEIAIATVKQGIAADDKAAAQRINAAAHRRAKLVQRRYPAVVGMTPGLNVAAWPILPPYQID